MILQTTLTFTHQDTIMSLSCCTGFNPTFVGQFYLKAIQTKNFTVWIEYCPYQRRKLLAIINNNIHCGFVLVRGNSVVFEQEVECPAFMQNDILKMVDLR